MHTETLPKGPKGHLISGNLREFRKDFLDFLTLCARDYGDIVPLRLGLKRIILVNRPEFIEQILVSDYQNFIKSYIPRFLAPVLGNGLLLSEGDFWRRQRRMTQPAFHRNRIAAYGRIMVQFTSRMISNWQAGETRDIHDELMSLTSEIVAKTLFDADLKETKEVRDGIEAVMNNFTSRRESLLTFPDSFPTLGNLRLRRAVQSFDDIIYGFIKQRRDSGEDRGDLLSILLHMSDEDDGSRMNDKQVRDEAVTLFLAGHETTANALAWTWYLLSRHPTVEARLVDEVKTALGGRSPTVEDLPNLRYTEDVVSEVLRLYPPAYFLSREAVKDFRLGNYQIPAGTTFLISQWVTHRDPRLFESSDQFIPERWANGLAKRLPKCSYFPFGAGPRTCIGSSFAMMESVLILATIAQKFWFTIDANQCIQPRPTVTLRPKHGVKATLKVRQSLHESVLAC